MRGWKAALAACVLAAGTAGATEGGTQNIGLAAEGFFVGYLPPTGTYLLLYANQYAAEGFNDSHGAEVVPGFRATASILAPRLLKMTDYRLGGGRFGMYLALPLIDVHASAGGAADRRAGLGDPIIGTLLAWNLGAWNGGVGMDLVVPWGAYNPGRLANPGSHYASIRPILTSTLLSGPWELSAKVSYTVNAENSRTNYLSGQLFHTDYSASFAFSPAWRGGVNGFFVTQTTDDESNGVKVGDGNRMNTFAVGPAFLYRAGAASIDFKVLKEFAVRSKAEGTSVWVRGFLPL